MARDKKHCTIFTAFVSFFELGKSAYSCFFYLTETFQLQLWSQCKA